MKRLILILLFSVNLSAEMQDISCVLSDPRCKPPLVYRTKNKSDPVAYNVLVKFGGEVPTLCCLRFVFWSWIKAENSPPCTAETRKLFGKMCDVKVGEVFYLTPPFRTCDPVTDRTCR